MPPAPDSGRGSPKIPKPVKNVETDSKFCKSANLNREFSLERARSYIAGSLFGVKIQSRYLLLLFEFLSGRRFRRLRRDSCFAYRGQRVRLEKSPGRKLANTRVVLVTTPASCRLGTVGVACVATSFLNPKLSRLGSTFFGYRKSCDTTQPDNSKIQNPKSRKPAKSEKRRNQKSDGSQKSGKSESGIPKVGTRNPRIRKVGNPESRNRTDPRNPEIRRARIRQK